MCCATFSVKNAVGEKVLRIEAPFCMFSICGDVEFKVSLYCYYLHTLLMLCFLFLISQITTLGGEQVGKISKQWAGWVREMCTDADFFGITFPLDLDVYMKAVMLGAVMLIVNSILILIILNVYNVFVLIVNRMQCSSRNLEMLA